jgi:hypothetical protein
MKLDSRDIAISLICLLTWASARATDVTEPKIPTGIHAEPATDLNALFDNKTGWIGADAAYSAALGPDRVLWLFGDTLVGNVKDGRRVDCSMVNNTVAIQTGQGKTASVKFTIGKPKADGKPTSLFMPADGKGWLWPMGAVRIGGKLYLILPQIDRAGGGGAFGFKQIAQWLGVVENPDEEPGEWKLTQQKIPFCDFTPGKTQSFGSALLVVGDDVFIYGIDEQGNGIGRKRLIVARAPAADFADFKTWRFRTTSGWSERSTDAVPLADGLASEFSVSAMPGGKEYVLVNSENGLSDRIMGRFADKPDGPWTNPVLLYTSPEMKADKGVFCYSAKAHAWAAKGNELVITYCQNTWEFGKVFQSDVVYRPKFVRVSWKASE